MAPLVDVLRGNPKFASRRARKLNIPWASAQKEAMAQIIHCLTSPPILALPNWHGRFVLHTNVSETGAGAGLTQIVEGIDRAIAFASHRWLWTDGRSSQTGREAAAVLWAVERFEHYLWGRKFPSLTVPHSPDCSKAKTHLQNFIDGRSE